MDKLILGEPFKIPLSNAQIMPKKIIFEFTKSEFTKLCQSNENYLEIISNAGSLIRLELEKEELEVIQKLLTENESFEAIRIELPGTISFTDVFTDDVISKGYPKLKISIREQFKKKESYLEYL